MEGEGIKVVIEEARLEDLSHFESCIDRIFQLGGEFPKDIVDFCKQAGTDFLQSDKSTTQRNLIEMFESITRCNYQLEQSLSNDSWQRSYDI